MSLKNLAYITKAMNKQLHNIYITRTKIEKNGTLISLDNTKDVTKYLHNTLKRRQPPQKRRKIILKYYSHDASRHEALTGTSQGNSMFSFTMSSVMMTPSLVLCFLK